MPAATLVSQNLQDTLPWVLKPHTHHPVPVEQNTDEAVACTYLETLLTKINKRYDTVIKMNTAVEGTMKHVTARDLQIPDGCLH